jgi:hypothetical protein
MYAFFSLFPLLLALVSILGFVLEGDPSLRNDVIRQPHGSRRYLSCAPPPMLRATRPRGVPVRGWRQPPRATPLVDPFWIPMALRDGSCVWWRNRSTEDVSSNPGVDGSGSAVHGFIRSSSAPRSPALPK